MNIKPLADRVLKREWNGVASKGRAICFEIRAEHFHFHQAAHCVLG